MYLRYYNRYSTTVQVIIHNSAKLSIENFKDGQVKHMQLSIWLTGWFKFSFILARPDQCCRFSRILASFTPDIIYFHYHNYFTGSKYQNIIIVESWKNNRWTRHPQPMDILSCNKCPHLHHQTPPSRLLSTLLIDQTAMKLLSVKMWWFCRTSEVQGIRVQTYPVQDIHALKTIQNNINIKQYRQYLGHRGVFLDPSWVP